MNIKLTKSEMKKEAISRMSLMGIQKSVINRFRQSDKIFVFEPPFGGLYDLSDTLKEQIKEFEEKYNALVYMVVKAYTHFGTLDSLLYVSQHQEEWEMDQADIKVNYVMTYTINQTDPICSEFGSICYKTVHGSVIRIG